MPTVPSPQPGLTRRGVTILCVPAMAGAMTLVGTAAPAAAAPLPAAPLRAAPPAAPVALAPTVRTIARRAVRTVARHDVSAAEFQLRRGQRGPDVARVQRRLGVRPSSGIFGPRTHAAVRRFQAQRGLPVTGVVTLSTWNALAIGAPTVTPPAARRPAPGTPAFGKLILTLALKHQGKPYRYGASGPSAFDCSGLTSWVYREAGYTLPRSSRAQRAATTYVGTPVPGDLAFVRRSGVVRHVGIYVGNGRWFEASTRSKPIGFGKARWGSNISFGRVR